MARNRSVRFRLAACALGAWASTWVGAGALQAQDAAPSSPSPDLVQGAWLAQEYVLAAGPTHPLRGHILFAEGHWSVLYLVLDEDGVPRRASGEGGTYTLNGDDLVFGHLYYAAGGQALDGLAAAPFEMRAADGEGTEEHARVAVDGDRMTLSFPSGNRMTFLRTPR